MLNGIADKSLSAPGQLNPLGSVNRIKQPAYRAAIAVAHTASCGYT
jgi:hypothetical protein